MHDATRQFVSAVAVEMRIVADGFRLVGKTVCGIVHKGPEGPLGAQSLKESLAHRIQIDQSHLLLGGNFAHGAGICGE